MERCIEQYQYWSGGLILPSWTDVEGWHEGHFSIMEVPRTPVPTGFQKMLLTAKPMEISRSFLLYVGRFSRVSRCPCTAEISHVSMAAGEPAPSP